MTIADMVPFAIADARFRTAAPPFRCASPVHNRSPVRGNPWQAGSNAIKTRLRYGMGAWSVRIFLKQRRRRSVRSTVVSGCWAKVERVTGIEPVYSAWKAAALPLCYTRPLA